MSFSRTARWFVLLACAVIPPLALLAQESEGPPKRDLPADLPAWAYGYENVTEGQRSDTPDSAARGGKDDGTLRHIPGSSQAFTLTQLRDNYGPADWFPNDHPAMPPIVAHGHKPTVTACSFCHYPNGKGRPVNTNLAGLPYSYIMQQFAEFKSGARSSSDTRKANTNIMIGFTKSMTDDEMKDAAQYFSSMKWTPWIRVIETDMVPKTEIANGIFLRVPGNEKEPIGKRIIETPEDVERMEVLRDPRSGFIAYVPTGSIKKGEALVMTGGSGKTTACTICHGSDLTGLGPLPGLAGRSPSYLVRQLYDMKHGKRTAEWAELMIPVVVKLSSDDMLAIAAYLASLPVSSTSSMTTSK